MDSQVLHWIRANPETLAIAVAMFSGSFLLKDIIKGHAEGADYFIPKPANFEKLVEIVSAADKGLAADPKTARLLRGSPLGRSPQ